MENITRVYLDMQTRRMRTSMFFFCLGILVFVFAACFFYFRGGSHIATIMMGVSVWSTSIVYPLYSINREIIHVLREADK